MSRVLILIAMKIDYYKTYMWKLYKDDTLYCFQSKDPRVKRKMARRKDFSVFNTWSDGTMVYITEKNTPQSAKRTLYRLTGSEVKYLPLDDVFIAITNTIVTSKEEAVVQINKEKGSHNDEGE